MDYIADRAKQWAGTSQWRAWRCDWARFRKLNGLGAVLSPGFLALSVYRMQKGVSRAKPGWLWFPVKVPLAVLKKIVSGATLINLPVSAEIGPGLFLPHAGPIQVFPGTRIGADCTIHHGCTRGAGARPGAPSLGDHVSMGCHSCVLGPTSVGDRAKIGAGAVVVRDIPAGAPAVGVPSRVVTTEGSPRALDGGQRQAESAEAIDPGSPASAGSCPEATMVPLSADLPPRDRTRATP